AYRPANERVHIRNLVRIAARDCRMFRLYGCRCRRSRCGRTGRRWRIIVIAVITGHKARSHEITAIDRIIERNGLALVFLVAGFDVTPGLTGVDDDSGARNDDAGMTVRVFRDKPRPVSGPQPGPGRNEPEERDAGHREISRRRRPQPLDGCFRTAAKRNDPNVVRLSRGKVGKIEADDSLLAAADLG